MGNISYDLSFSGLLTLWNRILYVWQRRGSMYCSTCISMLELFVSVTHFIYSIRYGGTRCSNVWHVHPSHIAVTRSYTHVSDMFPDSKVHGAHLGPTGPRWAPCWPHELCYLGHCHPERIHYHCVICVFVPHTVFSFPSSSSHAFSNLKKKNRLDTYVRTSSDGNIFRVTGPLWGEFTGDRWIPRTKASDAELWCKRLSKQSWGWWLETPSVHYDVSVMYQGPFC